MAPLTKMKILPWLKPFAKYRRRRLRRDAPHPPAEDGGNDAEIDGATASPPRSPAVPGDDRGSHRLHMPISLISTSLGDDESAGPSREIPGGVASDGSLESDASPVAVRTDQTFDTGPSEVSESDGPSTTLVPAHDNPNSASSSPASLPGDGDATTEVWNNLTDRAAEAEASSGENVAKAEVRSPLPSTLAGREETPANDGADFGANLSREKGKAKEEVKVVVATVRFDDEVELLCGNAVVSDDAGSTTSSQETLLSSSHFRSSTSTASLASSKSAQGFLRPHARALGFGPFTEPGLLVPRADAGPQRRAHLSNTSGIGRKESGLDGLLGARASGVVSSDGSDDSTASLECLARWCGVSYGAEGLEAWNAS